MPTPPNGCQPLCSQQVAQIHDVLLVAQQEDGSLGHVNWTRNQIRSLHARMDQHEAPARARQEAVRQAARTAGGWVMDAAKYILVMGGGALLTYLGLR